MTIDVHKRLLQLRRQQLSRQQRQRVLKHEFKSCLSFPCVVRKAGSSFRCSPIPKKRGPFANTGDLRRRGAAAKRTPQPCRGSAKRRRKRFGLSRVDNNSVACHTGQRGTPPEFGVRRRVSQQRCSQREHPESRTEVCSCERACCYNPIHFPCPSCKTYYSTLGVKADADSLEIRKAFLRLAAKWHPDKGGRGHRFLHLQQAYDVLKHPESRRAYDVQIACQKLLYNSTIGETVHLPDASASDDSVAKVVAAPPYTTGALSAAHTPIPSRVKFYGGMVDRKHLAEASSRNFVFSPEDSAQPKVKSLTTASQKRSITWNTIFFRLMRELFFKPIPKDCTTQGNPSPCCHPELFERLLYLLKRVPRLRYRRSLFNKTFCIDLRCRRWADERFTGRRRLPSKPCRPVSEMPCLVNVQPAMKTVSPSEWRQLSRQSEESEDENSFGRKGGNCQFGCGFRCSLSRSELKAVGGSQKCRCETVQREGRTSECTWWVAALREQLGEPQNNKRHEYRYVQLLPPPEKNEGFACVNHVHTWSAATNSTVTSQNSIFEDTPTCACSSEKDFELETKLRIFNLEDIPKTYKNSSSEAQMVPLWGMVFFKDRQVTYDLRSTADKVVCMLGTCTSSLRGLPQSRRLLVQQSRRSGASPCAASRKTYSPTGQRDEQVFPRWEVQTTQTSENRAESTSLTCAEPPMGKQAGTSLSSVMADLLRQFTVRDCLVVRTASLDRFPNKSTQHVMCNACRGGSVPRVRGTPKTPSSATAPGLPLTTVAYNVCHGSAPNRFIKTCSPQHHNAVPVSNLTTDENRAVESRQNPEPPAATIQTNAASLCLPIWVVTILQSEQVLSDSWGRHFAHAVSPASAIHYYVTQPPEKTLRWLCRALTELCVHATHQH